MGESARGTSAGVWIDGDEPLPSSLDQPATSDQRLTVALSLVRRLAHSNLQSLQIAKQLMVAQDLAELRTGRARWAIDHAADSGGDPEAIDNAVAAVAAAERAEADERALALAWALHRSEVSKLTDMASEMVDETEPRLAAKHRAMSDAGVV
jgi:hypothetical protein